MGIRLHKVMGYGFADVHTNDSDEIDDPRINTSCAFLTYEDDRQNMTTDAYLQHLISLHAQQRDLMHTDRDDQKARLELQFEIKSLQSSKVRQASDALHWGTPDGGLLNVLCITALSMPDWYRFDDIIDHVEEQEIHNGPHDHVRMLSAGIYPFSGAYIDVRTGEKLSSSVMMWVREKNSVEPIEVELDYYAQEAGFSGHEEALANVAPLVPSVITNFARWAGLFTSEQVLYQLRPMIYTYWR